MVAPWFLTTGVGRGFLPEGQGLPAIFLCIIVLCTSNLRSHAALWPGTFTRRCAPKPEPFTGHLAPPPGPARPHRRRAPAGPLGRTRRPAPAGMVRTVGRSSGEFQRGAPRTAAARWPSVPDGPHTTTWPPALPLPRSLAHRCSSPRRALSSVAPSAVIPFARSLVYGALTKPPAPTGNYSYHPLAKNPPIHHNRSYNIHTYSFFFPSRPPSTSLARHFPSFLSHLPLTSSGTSCAR